MTVGLLCWVVCWDYPLGLNVPTQGGAHMGQGLGLGLAPLVSPNSKLECVLIGIVPSLLGLREIVLTLLMTPWDCPNSDGGCLGLLS